MPIGVTVCVGSSCHIRGSRAVIKRFSELIKEYGLEDDVTLVGCFCMERCAEGVNWKVQEEDMSSASVEEAEETFRRKVIEEARRK